MLLLKCADISIFILFPFFPHTHITCKKHSFPIIIPKALLSPLLGCWFICQSILPNCFSPALNELFCSKSPLNLFCWSKPRFSNNWTVEWFNEQMIGSKKYTRYQTAKFLHESEQKWSKVLEIKRKLTETKLKNPP